MREIFSSDAAVCYAKTADSSSAVEGDDGVTSRERIKTVLSHREADCVPYRMRLDRDLEERFNTLYCGGAHHCDFFDDDIHSVNIDGEFIYPVSYDAYSFDDLPMPAEASFAKMKRDVETLHVRGKAAFNPYTPGVYETMTALMGPEEALAAMVLDPGGMHKKIEKVAQWEIELAVKKAMTGIDIMLIGDDLGAQKSLIMSPECYRAFYKPWHAELVNRVKRANPEVKVAFHCCGYVVALIPDLIDCGIDILETLQPEANNDRVFIKEQYGKDLCFWGGIGMQSVFWGRPPEYVIGKVREAIELLAPGGGYICAPCHIATPDIPPENIKAFYDAVNKYKYYA